MDSEHKKSYTDFEMITSEVTKDTFLKKKNGEINIESLSHTYTQTDIQTDRRQIGR